MKKFYLVMSVCTDETNGKITKEPLFVVDTEDQAIKDCEKFKNRPTNDITGLMTFDYIYEEIKFYPTIKEG